MDGNLMLERQPPVGGLGPPPRVQGRDYPPPFFKPRPPPVVVAGERNGGQAPTATSQSMTVPRSPRLLITPSSPDNVGPALGRLGRSIGMSVEMLATVGETIGEENPDIRGDMQDACRESRQVSTAGLEKLCESMSHTVIGSSQNGPGNVPQPLRGSKSNLLLGVVTQADLEALVRTLRRLLAAVTRILLLADNVVVKQLLVASCSSGTIEKKTKKANASAPVGNVPSSTSIKASVVASISTMHHFNEFVKAFCDFGSDMVHLIRITAGQGENCPKEERWRSQIESARVFLERSSTLLLISSKTFQRHPQCPSARENRDTVFCQMRRALDLIHYIIKEGVMDCTTKFGLDGVSGSISFLTACDEQDNETMTSTVLRAIKYFQDSVEIMRMSIISESYKDQLTCCLESITERIQDFTDSAYTTHEHRQNIILLCERAKIELSHVLSCVSNNSTHHHHGQEAIDMTAPQLPSHEVDSSMEALLKTTTELRLELQQTSLELASILLERGQRAQERVHNSLLTSAMTGDFEQLQMSIEKLTEHIDFVEDVAKLVRHVTWTESAQVRAKHAQINLHIYGPQVAVAATTLCQEPRSKVAKDNFETFCKMWQFLLSDVIQISQQVAEQTNQLHSMALQSLPPPPRIIKEPPTPTHSPPYTPMHNAQAGNTVVANGLSPPQVNNSLASGMAGKFHNKSVPNLSSSLVNDNPGAGPGGQSNTLTPPTSSTAGLSPRSAAGSNYLLQQPSDALRRHSTSGVPGYNLEHAYYPQRPQRPEDILDSYPDVENNDMVKRAKKMAQQANDMFAFTRGQGKVKTTQDLFTLAEYFAEECNILYKVIRLFSYDVPTGEDKRVLMALADGVPKHCHQLQMLIQSPTVGKAATFTKVDSIIKETRQIVNLVVRVTQMCYNHSKKYNLDFSNISLEKANAEQDTSSMDNS